MKILKTIVKVFEQIDKLYTHGVILTSLILSEPLEKMLSMLLTLPKRLLYCLHVISTVTVSLSCYML